MRTGSFRWWFEHRQTGQITIAQFPNWPLWGIAACWLARRLAGTDSTLGEVAGWTSMALWLFWAGDEVIRGVNPWRRALGATVIVWQVFTLL